MYVDWTDGKYGGTNLFVGSEILRCSTDAGTSWSSEAVLTDTPSSSFPSIAIESIASPENERVAVVWHNESQPFLGVSLKLSTDAGVSWLPHIAVTDSTHQTLTTDVAIAGDKIHVVWEGREPGVPDQIFYRRGLITTTSVSRGSELPLFVHLFPAYPNPFNPTTVLKFDLPQSSTVSLVVYDILGRRIADLASGYYNPGQHSITWNATNQASGVYFARFSVMSAQGIIQYSRINKLVLIK